MTEDLTDRQQQIADMYRTMSAKQIAARLGISPKTVYNTIYNIEKRQTNLATLARIIDGKKDQRR